MNTTNNDEIEFVDETLLESTSSGSPTTTISSSIFSDSTFSSMSQSGLLNNRYIVKQTIGRGSFGVVSIVVDTKHDDTELALKQIPCEDDNEINKAMQEVWPIRFLQHDNLVQYKSVFVHAVQGVMSRSLCIIMPYYSGGDLHQLIQTRNEYQQRFSESELVNYMNQLLSAVEYLHTKRLIHRDLKPSNIYVSDNEETLNIGDFGLVRELDSSQANTVAGTLRYIAPEILVHKKYGEKADLFSLGCIFLEMICLGLDRIMYVVALTNPNYQLEIKQEILTHGYSESLASLVCAMLEYAPESRISASEALCKLNQVDMPVSDTSQHERLASIVDELFAEIEDGKMSIEDIMSNVRVREITDDVEFLFQSVTQFGTDSIVTNDRLYIRKSPIRNVLMLAMDDLFSAKYFKNKILLQLSKKNNGWILLVDLYNVDRFQRIFKSFGHIDINQFTDVVSNCTLIQVSDDGSQIKKLETKNIALEIASRIDHYFSEYVYAFMRIIHERERKSGVGISLDDMFKFPRFGDINVNSVPREEIITAIQSKCTFVRLVQHEGTNYIKRIRPYTMRETRTANNLDFHFGQRYERNAFSVMSYNVLAEYLAQDEMYDYVNSKVKKWSKRRNFICSQIQYYRPAIVCLQEVQSNSTGTENHYSEILTKLEDAYVGTYKRKTSTKNVDTGVATFIRNDSELIVLKTFTIEFGKLLLKHCTGYSSNLFRQGFSQVAQIHHLVHKGNGDQLLLCNVHLCNGGSTAHIQLHQVQILLNQIQEYMTKNSIQKVIICGDFNSTPSSLVYELLSTGTLCNESLKLLETLCCNFSMKQKVWGHTFNLHSTYSSVLGQEPDFTVYTSETHICIDYIWHFNFNTLAVLDIPKEDDISKEIALPNRKHPSDHIPLLVLLK